MLQITISVTNARNNPVRFTKIVRNINFHHSSNSPNTSSVSYLQQRQISTLKKEFAIQSDTESLSQGGACMVDK